MSKVEEEQFQSTDTCLICENSLIMTMKKLDINCHITKKFRNAAHWSCNVNLLLTKKVPVIFHNLRGYDSHLIFNELKNFDVKIDVIPDRSENYMACF